MTKKAGLFDMYIYMATQLNEDCRFLDDKEVYSYKLIDDAILADMDMLGPFDAGIKNY